MRKELRMYLKYYNNYLRAFDKMLEAIKATGTVKNLSWQTGEDVMHWWISDEKVLQGQIIFDGFDLLDV